MKTTDTHNNPLRSVLPILALRIAAGAVILVLIIFLSHLGLHVARGAELNTSLDTAFSNTVSSLGRFLQGDFGTVQSGSTSRYGTITGVTRPISEVVQAALVKSLGLLAASMLFAIPGGLLTGGLAAVRARKGWPLSLLLLSLLGISLPSFLTALLFQVGTIELGKMLGHSILPVGGFGWDKRLILPGLVLAARPFAQITRVTYATLRDVQYQDYVRTAYSKGLPSRLVFNRHVMLNALIPILTTIGVSLRFSVSSLPVVEYFFGWGGMGQTLLQAISSQDDNLAVALILTLGLLFSFINIALDLLYRVIDPRMRDTPEHIHQGSRLEMLVWLRSLPGRWADFVRRIRRLSPLPPLIADSTGKEEEDTTGHRSEVRLWLSGTLGNIPLILGSLVVLSLLVIVLFGIELTPLNPYTTRGMSFEGGEFHIPPFEPDEVYRLGTDPLGRDLLSLILAGAQPTITLITLVVLVRVLAGFLIGSLAGWFSGSWVDRAAVGIVEVLSAFPTLLLAMILILSFGLRAGMFPFLLALSVVGWGELMQVVRGEVMKLRPALFVENAVSVGQGSMGIIMHHMLPNVIPILVSLAALEMGAALMLLGELGFLGIFIGGGSFASVSAFSPPFHYSDIPEWGAMLANIRTYARPYPWTAIYPALAFFIAILGFNLFGEGVRQLMDTVGVRIARLVNRYTLAAGALLVASFFWLRGSTGAMASYMENARSFDGEHALAKIMELTQPELMGRALGSAGHQETAQYIANQFKELGLQPAGEALSYFQTRKRDFSVLSETPSLTIPGSDPLLYRKDFSEFGLDVYPIGKTTARVVVPVFNELVPTGINTWLQYPALQRKEFFGSIIMVLSEEKAQYFLRGGWAGMLVVADDPADVHRRRTLAAGIRRSLSFWQEEDHEYPGSPALIISEETANSILASTGYTVAELRSRAEELKPDQIEEVPLGVEVTIEVPGEVQENVPVQNVLGSITGTAGSEGIPDWAKMNNQLVVVTAQYDEPPMTPGGEIFHGANSTASGVAVMLEAIRAMRESGYQPYRTMLFVAYSGEGDEGGRRVKRDIRSFLQAKTGFSTSFELTAVIEIGPVGGDGSAPLVIKSNGSTYLEQLFTSAARRVGVKLEQIEEDVSFSDVFPTDPNNTIGEKFPELEMYSKDAYRLAHLPIDVVEEINPRYLEDNGTMVTLALMALGREH